MKWIFSILLLAQMACERNPNLATNTDLSASQADGFVGGDLRAADLGATDLGAAQTDLAVSAAGAKGGFVWQGFEHEWLRTVAGFKVPHRISRLASFIDEQNLTSEAPPQGTALFHFGQATGVDGNYMKPIGHFSALGGAVQVTQSSVKLAWTDDATGTTYPKAQSTRSAVLEESLLGVLIDGTSPEVGTMVLNGISLVTACDDAKQPVNEPCNSDGMWPYRMSFTIGDCTITTDKLSCPLDVEINRAWTPNKGGLPPFEEKPFNDKLDFDLTVYYSTWLGHSDDLVVKTSLITASGKGHDNDPKSGKKTLVGNPGFAAATVGISRFGFLFGKADNTDKSNHLGRYIGTLRFFATAGDYRIQEGELDVDWATQVWLPDTVEEATVAYELGLRLLSTRGQSNTEKSVQGSLCADSQDAPFFSAWKRCDEPAYGPPQTEQAIQISQP